MPKRPHIALLAAAFVATAVFACAALKSQAAEKLPKDPTALLLEGRKACMLYSMAPGPKDPAITDACATLLTECHGAEPIQGAGGSP